MSEVRCRSGVGGVRWSSVVLCGSTEVRGAEVRTWLAVWSGYVLL